jgi:signal transduction histidine kinase
LTIHKIGKVEFDFWLFDRDPAVIRLVTDDIKGLKDYLDDNGGIRIYRDGIRVYDFGEPGNDWLNLDMRRINTPTARTSNNQILGILRLDATTSVDLREKSNREGFIENQAYADLRNAVISLLTQVEAEKSKDQRRVREASGKGTGQKVFAKLAELRAILEDKGVLVEVENKLKAVEKEMEIYRDQLLHAAVPGLTMGVMLHGAEKILEELREATRKGSDNTRINELVDRLYRAMRPVTNLLKNPGTAKTSAGILIKEAIFSAELRLKRHGISLVNGMDSDCPDFKMQGSKQMLIASITNLIDNSIHWLEMKNPKQRLIFIGTTNDIEGGPAIVVADNGPGFGNDTPEDLVTPFFTRRNGGMGLGLYIVSEVMRVNHGRLVFPEDGDIDLPRTIDGAVVAIQFSETS